MDFLQKRIGDWARDQFGEHRTKSLIAHMKREVQELEEAIEEGRIENIIQEAADVGILLLNLAASEGFSLHNAILDKHAINTRRKWGAPDEEGVVEHEKR